MENTTVVVRPPLPKPDPGKARRPPLLAMLLGAMVGALLGYLGMRIGADLLVRVPGPKWIIFVHLLALPVAWMVAVGVHELGHIAGGWLTGGRFLLWSVGPFMLRRTPAGIRFFWNRSFNAAGGLGACVPLEPERLTPRRAAVMILGGPLASLVLLAAALWLAQLLVAPHAPPTIPSALAQHGALLVAGLSLLIFLATSFPSTAGGMKSDGRRLIELLRGGAHSDQEAAMLVLTAASLAGIRPAAWDPALVARSLALRDGSLFDRYGHLNAYYAAADRGEWAAAQAHLDHVLAGEEQLAPFVRDVVRSEYAWLLATRTHDAANARAWLESAGRSDFDQATHLRAEAAVLLAEGRCDEAAATARAALHALEHKNLSPTINPFAADAIHSLLRRATGA